MGLFSSLTSIAALVAAPPTGGLSLGWGAALGGSALLDAYLENQTQGQQTDAFNQAQSQNQQIAAENRDYALWAGEQDRIRENMEWERANIDNLNTYGMQRLGQQNIQSGMVARYGVPGGAHQLAGMPAYQELPPPPTVQQYPGYGQWGQGVVA